MIQNQTPRTLHDYARRILRAYTHAEGAPGIDPVDAALTLAQAVTDLLPFVEPLANRECERKVVGGYACNPATDPDYHCGPCRARRILAEYERRLRRHV
jgi:hypothetical protein